MRWWQIKTLLASVSMSLVFSWAGIAGAIEEIEYPGPDHVALQGGDYKILDLGNQFGTDIRNEVDETFMVPIVEAVDPGSIYGFSFAFLDLTGDGLDDLVLRPKIPDMIAPEGFDGVAYLIYVQEGGRWRLAIEGGGVAVAIRDGAEGAKDVALSQFESGGGLVEYVFREGTFHRIDR